jgi:TRAP-type C4-dicarboxylate transport system permease small subunit
MPQVSAPERVWGYEDVLFLIAYGCDVTHMSMIQKAASWGLGRHYFYLNEEQRTHAMKWDFMSQPIGMSVGCVDLVRALTKARQRWHRP